MYKMNLPLGAITDDFDDLVSYCNAFKCKAYKAKRGQNYNVIETDDPINFFWLGGNLNIQCTSSLGITPSQRFLKAK